MTISTNICTRGRSLAGRLRAIFADRRGVAAIEFAFIAPVMLALYFVTLEVGQGIETNKKVGRTASMTADLVTQQSEITKSELDAIMQIGGSILQPYNRSQPKIIITAIQVTTDPTPKVLVAWSRKLVNGTGSADAAKGSTTTVPAALKTAGSFLIRVESDLNYTPVIAWTVGQKESLGLSSAFSNIDMAETYYLRPRMSTTITCKDC